MLRFAVCSAPVRQFAVAATGRLVATQLLAVVSLALVAGWIAGVCQRIAEVHQRFGLAPAGSRLAAVSIAASPASACRSALLASSRQLWLVSAPPPAIGFLALACSPAALGQSGSLAPEPLPSAVFCADTHQSRAVLLLHPLHLPIGKSVERPKVEHPLLSPHLWFPARSHPRLSPTVAEKFPPRLNRYCNFTRCVLCCSCHCCSRERHSSS